MTKLISEQIKEHIENSEMSLYRLAIESGVGLRVLSRFVKENSDMKLSTLNKIARTLNLNVSREESVSEQ